MSEETMKAFQQLSLYIQEHFSSCADIIDGYTDFIMIDKNGRVMTPKHLTDLVMTLVSKCNMRIKKEGKVNLQIRPTTCHTLRYTYATRMREAGVDIKAAQYLMGHATPQMTLDVYTDVTNALITQASNQLQSYLSSEESL